MVDQAEKYYAIELHKHEVKFLTPVISDCIGAIRYASFVNLNFLSYAVLDSKSLLAFFMGTLATSENNHVVLWHLYDLDIK